MPALAKAPRPTQRHGQVCSDLERTPIFPKSVFESAPGYLASGLTFKMNAKDESALKTLNLHPANGFCCENDRFCDDRRSACNSPDSPHNLFQKPS